MSPLENKRRAASSHRGLTLVEIMVALTIFTVCAYMLSSTITATIAHSVAKRERAIAVEAARNVFEDMYNEDFRYVFRLYNQDPSDDPNGAGTGPGPHFTVPGLDELPADPDGCAGEITFASQGPELYENVVDASLDMPRDLNGDAVVDGENHIGDHIVLPVCITIEWQGFAGHRQFRMYTMLSDVRKLEER